MKIRELSRYRGVLVATGFLVALVVLASVATKTLTTKSHIATSILDRLDLYEQLPKQSDGLPTEASFGEWQQALGEDRAADLELIAPVAYSQLKDALVTRNEASARTSFLEIHRAFVAEAQKRHRIAAIAPIALAIVSLLIFLLAIIPLLLRLSSDKEVQVESNQQAENILNTVSEGLFLLDKNGDIGVEQSASLKQMFRMERDLEGSFLDFIGNYVPVSSVTVAKDYLDLLYGDRVKEKLVRDLNPLNKVEISITRRDGTMESRFLDFKFARVMVDSKLEHLLGSVTDVTKEVMLERELAANKQEQEAQLDLLMNILHIDKTSLSRFYSETEQALDSINEKLQEKGSSSDQIRNKLVTIAEQAHRIKGDAAALKLHNFEFIMHEFESAVEQVRATPGPIGGRDVIPAVTKLKDVFKELSNMQTMFSRFAEVLKVEESRAVSEIGGSADSEPEAPQTVQSASGLKAELQNLVSTLSQRNDVRVHLTAFGLEEGDIPEELKTVVRDSAIQLVRNSVAHGALTPAERLAQGKTDYLNLTVSFTHTEQGHTLIVRDDGQGLDAAAILAKAVEKGLLTAESAAKAPANLATKLIFHPGFSSKDEVDLDSGRGVGLSSVHSMVKELGGVIGLSQTKGKHCQFSVKFKAA